MVKRKISLSFRCVVFDSTLIPTLTYPLTLQFQSPHNVLRDHWERNGSPAPTPVPSSVRHGPPAPAVPSTTKSATAPARPRPKPTPKPIIPLPPVQEVVYLTLPPLDSARPAPSQSEYPQPWRKFIDHAIYYILRDMVFTSPFPTATEVWVSEAVITAFKSWSYISTVPLSKDSCASAGTKPLQARSPPFFQLMNIARTSFPL